MKTNEFLTNRLCLVVRDGLRGFFLNFFAFLSVVPNFFFLWMKTAAWVHVEMEE